MQRAHLCPVNGGSDTLRLSSSPCAHPPRYSLPDQNVQSAQLYVTSAWSGSSLPRVDVSYHPALGFPRSSRGAKDDTGRHLGRLSSPMDSLVTRAASLGRPIQRHGPSGVCGLADDLNEPLIHSVPERCAFRSAPISTPSLFLPPYT